MMNSEINDIPAAPASDTKGADKPKKKRNPPRSSEDRLKSFLSQLERVRNNKIENDKRERTLLRQIEKTKSDIQNEQIRGIYNVCKDKELSPAEAAAFISAVTDKMTFSEAAARLGIPLKTVGSEKSE